MEAQGLSIFSPSSRDSQHLQVTSQSSGGCETHFHSQKDYIRAFHIWLGSVFVDRQLKKKNPHIFINQPVVTAAAGRQHRGNYIYLAIASGSINEQESPTEPKSSIPFSITPQFSRQRDIWREFFPLSLFLWMGRDNLCLKTNGLR